MRRFIAPVDDELGDLDPGTRRDANEEADTGDEWEKLADKYEELEEKVRNYFEEGNNQGAREPPVVSAPKQMTMEE